jgi:hypothetical protein
MKTPLAVITSAMLLNACAGQQVIPDQRFPHRVAEPTKVVIWVKAKDKTLVKQAFTLPEGWWIAGPQVVESPLPASQAARQDAIGVCPVSK